MAYDGTDFYGWQVQKNVRTVQAVLAEAWKSLTGLHQYPEGSGRTDTGVHAAGQIASFRLCKDNIPPERYAFALNSYLPRDIRVLGSCISSEDFDVRRTALSRMYHYHIMVGNHIGPQDARYAMFLRRRYLSLSRLNTLAGLFVGRQNFRAFCSADDQSAGKVRTVLTSAFYPLADGRIRYEIRANGFLMNMVRAIVGSILFFHDKDNGEEQIRQALQTGEKAHLGPTAPACGLSLMHVEYPDFIL